MLPNLRYDEPAFVSADAALLNFQRKLHRALWTVHAHLHVLETERLGCASMVELRATASLLREAMAGNNYFVFVSFIIKSFYVFVFSFFLFFVFAFFLYLLFVFVVVSFFVVLWFDNWLTLMFSICFN